jgi:phenylpropionate dioxygenase-like ring-hydroxylating dioxygenase large terminal subunit
MKIFNILFLQFFISIHGLHIPNIFKLLSPKEVANKVLQHKPIHSAPTPIEKYDMSWYVVGESSNVKTNEPFKATIWSKDYVIWKTSDNKYHALEDICPHKGSALSIGFIHNDHITCPYHGYEFNKNGNLTVVPGICFHPSPHYNIPRFSVVEKHGWIYLNTYEIPNFIEELDLVEINENIFIEPEATDNTMSTIFISQKFNAYPRIVSENSLDIMHIAFVHTFGNRAKPAPSYENPPKEIELYHWRASYVYESGVNSMVSKLFHIKKIDIENEFALPHTTVARLKFGSNFVNTIVTAACPINENETKLFVKNYRNFLQWPIFDIFFYKTMVDTLKQDKTVIESIKKENMNGKFNMKFDKLQNTYKTLYKKFVKM